MGATRKLELTEVQATRKTAVVGEFNIGSLGIM